MPVPPFAVRRLIAAGASDPEIIPLGIILHVDAGNSLSLFNYFNGPSGGIESHAHVQLLGRTEWYRDTGREADANFKANSFIGADGKRYGFISIETQGYGDGEWTPAQIAAIKDIILWAHKVHGIPLRVCPGPFSGGVGFHTMWGAPAEWTPVSKSCPGPKRIKQFYDVIVPWMAEVAAAEAGPSKAEVAAAKQTDQAIATGKKKLWKGLHKLNKAAATDAPRAKTAARAARKVKAAIDLLKKK